MKSAYKRTYRKDGKANSNGGTYCKDHFIEKYGREPNDSDTVHLLSCSDFHHCNHRNGLGYVCHGLLVLVDKFRQDNQGVEEWKCQVCGKTTNFR